MKNFIIVVLLVFLAFQMWLISSYDNELTRMFRINDRLLNTCFVNIKSV